MDIDYNKMYNKMIVTDYGICIHKVIDDKYVSDSIVITKEAFVEAYNRWIKEEENDQTSNGTVL